MIIVWFGANRFKRDKTWWSLNLDNSFTSNSNIIMFITSYELAIVWKRWAIIILSLACSSLLKLYWALKGKLKSLCICINQAWGAFARALLSRSRLWWLDGLSFVWPRKLWIANENWWSKMMTGLGFGLISCWWLKNIMISITHHDDKYYVFTNATRE